MKLLAFLLFSTLAIAQTDLPGPVRVLPKENHSAVNSFCGWDKAQAWCAGFGAPATGMTANQIWTLPSVDGAANECQAWASAYLLSWQVCIQWTYVTSDPSGSCTTGSASGFEYNTTSGDASGCNNGTWALIGSSGAQISFVTMNPSGSCTVGSASNFAFNTGTGVLWGCNAGTWAPVQPADMATTDTTQSITGTKTFSSAIVDAIKFSTTNTTSAVAGVIGATCPATTCTSAHTWIQVTDAAGDTVYFPVWK